MEFSSFRRSPPSGRRFRHFFVVFGGPAGTLRKGPSKTKISQNGFPVQSLINNFKKTHTVSGRPGKPDLGRPRPGASDGGSFRGLRRTPRRVDKLYIFYFFHDCDDFFKRFFCEKKGKFLFYYFFVFCL